MMPNLFRATLPLLGFSPSLAPTSNFAERGSANACPVPRSCPARRNLNTNPATLSAWRLGSRGGNCEVQFVTNLAREECFPLNPWECLPELQPKPRAVDLPPKISKGRRFGILTRDGFQCLYCGRTAAHDRVRLHVDHVIPKSKGGSDADENLVTACKDCNLGKHNKHSGDPRRKRLHPKPPTDRLWIIRRLCEIQTKSLRRIDRLASLEASLTAQWEARDELYELALAEVASGHH